MDNGLHPFPWKNNNNNVQTYNEDNERTNEGTFKDLSSFLFFSFLFFHARFVAYYRYWANRGRIKRRKGRGIWESGIKRREGENEKAITSKASTRAKERERERVMVVRGGREGRFSRRDFVLELAFRIVPTSSRQIDVADSPPTKVIPAEMGKGDRGRKKGRPPPPRLCAANDKKFARSQSRVSTLWHTFLSSVPSFYLRTCGCTGIMGKESRWFVVSRLCKPVYIETFGFGFWSF